MIPSGSTLEVRLAQPISSGTHESGDRFEVTLDRDLEVDGHLVAREGSTLIGKLSNVERSGKVEGRAKLSMSLAELIVAGESHSVRTNTLSFEAEGSKKKDATKIGGGAGVGALIGAIAGGKKGAAIGAAVGGGAGTAAVVMTRGKEVQFEEEQLFQFELTRDVKIKVQ